jgi:predicted nucleic acid-binding protein
MIATQSMVESLTLVTRDAAFSALPGLRLAW